MACKTLGFIKKSCDIYPKLMWCMFKILWCVFNKSCDECFIFFDVCSVSCDVYTLSGDVNVETDMIVWDMLC